MRGRGGGLGVWWRVRAKKGTGVLRQASNWVDCLTQMVGWVRRCEGGKGARVRGCGGGRES